jgi:hypothetical protein
VTHPLVKIGMAASIRPKMTTRNEHFMEVLSVLCMPLPYHGPVMERELIKLAVH